MRYHTRIRGSRRASATGSVAIEQDEASLFVFTEKRKDKSIYMVFVPESDAEWKALMSQIHRGYRYFCDEQERYNRHVNS